MIDLFSYIVDGVFVVELNVENWFIFLNRLNLEMDMCINLQLDTDRLSGSSWLEEYTSVHCVSLPENIFCGVWFY